MPSDPASVRVPISKSGKRYTADEYEMDSPHEESRSPRTPERSEPTWVGIRRLCRDAFSEFLGVFILILFGNGVVAQVLLSQNTAGDYQSISWGWGYVFRQLFFFFFSNSPD